jgi:hypothetical protein
MTKVYQYAAITVSFSLVSVVLLLRVIRDIRGVGSPPQASLPTGRESFQ